MTASFDDLWPIVREHTVLHEHKARMIHELVEGTRSLGGDVAECGVFKGGISLMMAKQLVGIDDSLWAFDSFAGLPADRSAQETCYYVAGALSSSQEAFVKLLRAHGVENQVIVRPGWFADTLKGDLPLLRLVHIDCDVYSSVKCCLDRLYNRVVQGGVVIIDDFFDLGGGAEAATMEHLAKTGELLYVGPIEQAFFIKGRTATDHPGSYLGWRPRAPDPMRRSNGADLSVVLGDPVYLEDVRSGKAFPDLPGRSIETTRKLALRMLSTCQHHQHVLHRAKLDRPREETHGNPVQNPNE